MGSDAGAGHKGPVTLARPALGRDTNAPLTTNSARDRRQDGDTNAPQTTSTSRDRHEGESTDAAKRAGPTRGALCRNRTDDLFLTMEMLYRLS